jgi:Uma2 family endonuclease
MSTVVVGERVRIPAWVNDLESFRRWARSDAYPERGWISFLGGEIWVDTCMEQLFSHNRVKTCFTVVVGGLVEAGQRGYWFSDRVALSHEGVDLSTEPDGCYCSFEAIQQQRVRLVEGIEEGFVELEGTPDATLEVVSTNSVRKDTKVLRDLYWRAGVPEYWLVDARKTPLQFDILRRTSRGYVQTRRQHGWVRSRVLGRSFLLEVRPDLLGHPQYVLSVRDR